VEIKTMSEILYLIRHATPDWNRKDISYFVPPGPPLNDTGLEEAEMLANFFQFIGLKRIYTSPLERCLMTAKILARQNEQILQIEAGLSEHRPQESRADVVKRLEPVFKEAIQVASQGPVALVTHGSPIEILLSQMGMPAVELNALKASFDHHNPAPPAGVWEAVRSASDWDLSLVFDPQNARMEKIYGQI
jgi:broad specificity phosphatase PhoE